MGCPICSSNDLSPVGDQFFCVGCGKIIDKTQQLQGTTKPTFVKKQKTRWLLPGGKVMEFYAVVDQNGMFWVPAPVMMHILRVNKVRVSELKKEGDKDDSGDRNNRDKT